MTELAIVCAACAGTRAEAEPTIIIGRAQDYPEGMPPPGGPDDSNVLVCVPWGKRSRGIVSAPQRCDDCGQPIAVADSSIPLLRAHGRS